MVCSVKALIPVLSVFYGDFRPCTSGVGPSDSQDCVDYSLDTTIDSGINALDAKLGTLYVTEVVKLLFTWSMALHTQRRTYATY